MNARLLLPLMKRFIMFGRGNQGIEDTSDLNYLKGPNEIRTPRILHNRFWLSYNFYSMFGKFSGQIE